MISLKKPGENLVEYKNRAARFEKEIERFHSYLIAEGYSINSARNMTLGISQLFRYYQMPVRMRSGSKVSQTVQTTKNFPLSIEHVRKMFEVANLKERTILSLAVDTDCEFRISLKLRKRTCRFWMLNRRLASRCSLRRKRSRPIVF